MEETQIKRHYSGNKYFSLKSCTSVSSSEENTKWNEVEPLVEEFVEQMHRPGQLFLQLLGVLVALVEETGLSVHKLCQASHVVGLEKQ